MQPEKATLESVDEDLVETPPPYKAGSSSLQPVSRALPDIKPTNFMQLSRTSEVLRGAWIIDPAMVIPSAFLPPLGSEETEETRSNISLEVAQNGAIYAEIFVLPTRKETSRRQRIYIRALCRSGNVMMKMHEILPERVGETRWPMQISCSSTYGNVNLYVPRSFRGPINVLVGNGSVRFSDAMKPLVTLFSDIDGMQKSFLGDFDADSIQSAGEWAGDTLSAEARNGSVRIFFDDEDLPTPVPKVEAKGFIEKWFGSWS